MYRLPRRALRIPVEVTLRQYEHIEFGLKVALAHTDDEYQKRAYCAILKLMDKCRLQAERDAMQIHEGLLMAQRWERSL